MKKLLLILLMGTVGISVSVAQSIRTGAPANKHTASAKPIKHQLLATKPVKEVQTQVAPFSPFALNRDVKIISSVSRGDKKIEVVKNANGTFSKRIVQNNKIQKLQRKATTPTLRSVSANTFFESFEGWDGEDPDWLPNGWSRDNKTEIETWYISDGGFIAYPTDGEYAAWVDWGFDFDTFTSTDPRNEMLISPAFTPVEGDYIIFDACYSTYFMFYDIFTGEFDFDNPVFNIQVLASTDNGENWDVIWDASKAEEYSEYDENELENAEWYTPLISMSAYVGKSTKIAFRYTDRDGGDNIGLDNIAVREPNPTALYMRPQGYFKMGLFPDWRSYNANLMLGHAYDQAIWRNLSSDVEAHSWQFENPDGSGSTITSTKKNPYVAYPSSDLYDLFEIPILTASGGGKTSTYRWGNKNFRYIKAGGSMDLGDGIVGVGNYDLSYDMYTYTDRDGDYLFGTRPDSIIEGVANYFEKPVHKYILEGVWVALSKFSFPADTEFTMVIYRIVGGYDEEAIIATSTCTTADVVAISGGGFTMPFSTFITIDPEIDLEVENEYLEIEDAILIEIKGFNNIQGGEIAFLNQEFDVDPTGENNAYIFLADGRLVGYNGSTSLIFNLAVTYSFLLADSYEFIAPDAGGEKTFDVTSYYSPDGWWLEEDYPEWISDDLVFDSDTWEILYTLKAEPLPADIPYREAVMKIVTFGADMSILVQQGDFTGIPAIKKVENTKVVNKGNNFELTYTSDYSLVSIYNVAGQKVANYRLPDTGTFTVPAGNYSKGVYLFSFTGVKGASTVKVMK